MSKEKYIVLIIFHIHQNKIRKKIENKNFNST